MHIGSFKRNSRFNTGIMTMQTAVANAAAVGAGAGGAALGSSTVGGPAGGGLSLTMSMSGVGERCLDVVPEKFANVTKEDVPNSLKYYSDFFSMLEEEFNTLPDAEPEPSPLESNPDLALTHEQEQVLQMALSGMSLFFTGCAGTGKSLLLKEIVARLRKVQPPGTVYVTASTGIAACQVGGITLHTFAGVGLAKYKAESLVFKVKKDPVAVKRWRKVKVIVIDEISMLAGEFFDKVEYVARKIREDERPFGGIQVVLCGDFLQLPPVMAKHLCFECECWPRVVQKSVELTQVFRQSETEFISLLNEIRVGNVSFDTRSKLEECVRRSMKRKQVDDQLRQLKRMTSNTQQAAAARATTERRGGRGAEENENENENDEDEPYDAYYDEFGGFGSGNAAKRGGAARQGEEEVPRDEDIPPTQLFPTRREVAHRNHECLAALPGKSYFFRAVDEGKEPFLGKLQKYCPAPETLELKVGAQVILLMNLAFSGGLVNGARGVVTGFASDSSEVTVAGRTSSSGKAKRKKVVLDATYYPVVRFTTGLERIILPEEWKSEVGPKKVASRTQIPLNLAWALSIHKSQGMTLSKVEMNLSHVFAYGQAYVALSRAQNLEGLYLMGFEAGKVRAHPRVLEYYRRFSSSVALRRTGPSQPRPSPSSSWSVASSSSWRAPALAHEEPVAAAADFEADERQYREAWADEDEVTWE